MAGLNDIVPVTISAQTTTPTRTGFGTPLILTQKAPSSGLVAIVTSLADVVTEGYATTDAVYRMASAIFSQNPRPSQAKIGHAANAAAQKLYVILGTVANSTAYTVYIGGLAATYTSDASATDAEITAGLKAAIDALALNVTVTDDTGVKLTIDADSVADEQAFYIPYAMKGYLSQQNITPDTGGVATDLAAIRAQDDDWYCLLLTSQGKAEILAAAAYIEALTDTRKILVASTADDGCYDGTSTTDPMYELEALAYDRTEIEHNYLALEQYPCGAWAGKCLPKDPGSITWMFKTKTGITPGVYTPTEMAAMDTKKGNYYVTIGGVSITQKGVMTSGEYIDITRGTDYLAVRIQEEVFTALANADKIPFTNPGRDIIVSKIYGVLDRGVSLTILKADPAPLVSVDDVADISTTDRANRYFPGITFTGEYAGAIHKVGIAGVLTV